MTTINDTGFTGLTRATQKLSQAAERIATASGDDTAALLAAKASVQEYRANAAVLKLENDRQQSLLDILA